MHRLTWAIFVMTLAGCGADSYVSAGSDEATQDQDSEALLRSDSQFDSAFIAAGREFDVPAATLKALAWSLTRYEMVQAMPEHDDDVSRFGMMAISQREVETLAARLNVTAQQVKDDPATNIRAAAARLSSLPSKPAKTDDVLAWGTAAADYAGLTHYDMRKTFIQSEFLGALQRGIGPLGHDVVTKNGEAISALVAEHATISQGLARAPDYGAGLWRASPNTRDRSGGKTPKLVIIHTCEGSYTSCINTFLNPNSVSAHYVVSTTGEVTQMVTEAKRASHISAVYDCDRNGKQMCNLDGSASNDITVGVEHAGSQNQSSFPLSQIAESAKLVCSVTKRWNIPRDRFHIIGHGQMQPWNRIDPGKNWPWTDYMARINAACGTVATNTITIDDDNTNNDSNVARAEISANWKTSTNVAGYSGDGYHVAKLGVSNDGAAFRFKLDTAGSRTIDAWWASARDRSSSATFIAYDASGQEVGRGQVNQKSGGSQWNTVGSFAFTAGWNKIVLSRSGSAVNEVVVADAVRVR